MNHIRKSFSKNPWWTALAYGYVIYRAVTYVIAQFHISQKVGHFPWYITDYFNYYSRIFIFVFVLLPRSAEWQKKVIHCLIRYSFLPFANASFIIFCCSPFIRVIGGPGWIEQLLIKIDAVDLGHMFWLLDVSMHVLPFLFFCSLLYCKKDEIKAAIKGLSHTALNLQLLAPLPFMALWGMFYDFYDAYILEKSITSAILFTVIVGVIALIGAHLIKEILVLTASLSTKLKKGIVISLGISAVVSGVCGWGVLYLVLSPACWATCSVLYGVVRDNHKPYIQKMIILGSSILLTLSILLRTTTNQQLLISIPSTGKWAYYFQEFSYSMGMVVCIIGIIAMCFKRKR